MTDRPLPPTDINTRRPRVATIKNVTFDRFYSREHNAVGKARFDDKVLSFLVSKVTQRLAKKCEPALHIFSRSQREDTELEDSPRVLRAGGRYAKDEKHDNDEEICEACHYHLRKCAQQIVCVGINIAGYFCRPLARGVILRHGPTVATVRLEGGAGQAHHGGGCATAGRPAPR
jgi:hypothetical protein